MKPAILINLPDGVNFLTGSATFSTNLFATLVPMMATLVGVTVGGLFVAVLASVVLRTIRKAIRK